MLTGVSFSWHFQYLASRLMNVVLNYIFIFCSILFFWFSYLGAPIMHILDLLCLPSLSPLSNLFFSYIFFMLSLPSCAPTTFIFLFFPLLSRFFQLTFYFPLFLNFLIQLIEFSKYLNPFSLIY